MLSKQTTINMWRHAHLFRIYGTIDMENQWLWKIERERERKGEGVGETGIDMKIVKLIWESSLESLHGNIALWRRSWRCISQIRSMFWYIQAHRFYMDDISNTVCICANISYECNPIFSQLTFACSFGVFLIFVLHTFILRANFSYLRISKESKI